MRRGVCAEPVYDWQDLEWSSQSERPWFRWIWLRPLPTQSRRSRLKVREGRGPHRERVLGVSVSVCVCVFNLKVPDLIIVFIDNPRIDLCLSDRCERYEVADFRTVPAVRGR